MSTQCWKAWGLELIAAYAKVTLRSCECIVSEGFAAEERGTK